MLYAPIKLPKQYNATTVQTLANKSKNKTSFLLDKKRLR